jgi:hypothetical protein
MVYTRTSEDAILDIPKDPLDVGMAKSHVAVPHLHHLLSWSNY